MILYLIGEHLFILVILVINHFPLNRNTLSVYPDINQNLENIHDTKPTMNCNLKSILYMYPDLIHLFDNLQIIPIIFTVLVIFLFS